VLRFEGENGMTFYSKDNPTRYPYTFAYDWFREAGLAESRADAAKFVRERAEELGLDAEELIFKAADEYIAYWSAHEEAEQLKRDKFMDWSNLLRKI
jgi:hypothetical protein